MVDANFQQSTDGTPHQIINLCWMPFLLRHFHGIKSFAMAYAQGSSQGTKPVNALGQVFEDLAVLTHVNGGAVLHRESYQGFFFYKKESISGLKVTFFSSHNQNF